MVVGREGARTLRPGGPWVRGAVCERAAGGGFFAFIVAGGAHPSARPGTRARWAGLRGALCCRSVCVSRALADLGEGGRRRVGFETGRCARGSCEPSWEDLYDAAGCAAYVSGVRHARGREEVRISQRRTRGREDLPRLAGGARVHRTRTVAREGARERCG